MQLLAEVGREHGNHQGLGWLPGEVVRLAPSEPALKVPHMGWNSLSLLQPHALFEGMADGTDVYFVHSYYIRPSNAAHILATTDYGGSIPAIVGRDNIAGTQFHPEKSQAEGLAFLERFLKWRP
jgi:glutamine amidotransferase